MAIAVSQRRGTSAVIAMILAVLSIILTFSGSAVLGLVLALAAIVAGAIGLASSASPRVSGGMTSIAAVVIAIFGLGLAVLRMIGAIIF
jgi:hypothetical protein